MLLALFLEPKGLNIGAISVNPYYGTTNFLTLNLLNF